MVFLQMLHLIQFTLATEGILKGLLSSCSLLLVTLVRCFYYGSCVSLLMVRQLCPLAACFERMPAIASKLHTPVAL